MAKSGFAKEHLKSFIERIERLEEEKAALTADIAIPLTRRSLGVGGRRE